MATRRHGSAFSIDLRQAAFSINFATRRSLIIIDEFGKGTNALDGPGLAAGLLDHFLSLGAETPKMLVASPRMMFFRPVLVGRLRVSNS